MLSLGQGCSAPHVRAISKIPLELPAKTSAPCEQVYEAQDIPGHKYITRSVKLVHTTCGLDMGVVKVRAQFDMNGRKCRRTVIASCGNSKEWVLSWPSLSNANLRDALQVSWLMEILVDTVEQVNAQGWRGTGSNIRPGEGKSKVKRGGK